MSILKKYQKTDKRFERDDLIVYEPTQEQKEEIINMIMEKSKLTDEGVEGEIGTKEIRYLYRELTSLGSEIDDYTDEELDVMFENGNHDLICFQREIEKLLDEIATEIFYEKEKEVKSLLKVIDILSANTDMAEVEKKFNNLMKKNKTNLTYQEFVENANNPEKLQELMKRKKVNRKKK